MSAGKSSALASIVAEMGTGEAHAPADGGNQLDLLGAELDEEIAPFAGAAIAPPAKRGPGRPLGSTSRSTKQMVAFLRARGYRDPLEFLASLYTMDTRDLMRAIGSEDPDKVLELQRKAASEAAKYAYSAMPTVIEAPADQGRPILNIVIGGATPALAGEAAPFIDIKQYQEVSEGDAAASHGDASHESRNHE